MSYWDAFLGFRTPGWVAGGAFLCATFRVFLYPSVVLNNNLKSQRDPMNTFTEPGRGRKQCPECDLYIGAATSTCVCGHIFTEKDKKAPKVTVLSDDAGKGKKQCPECKKYVGARSSVCKNCGYEFTPGVKESKVVIHDEPGRGRRPCQECNKYFSIRLENCPGCGAVAVKAEKVKKLPKLHDDPAPGRRHCLKCNKYFAVVLKICPGCGTVAVKVEKVVEITTYDEPGKLRKQCPECEKYLNHRAIKCACSHEFPPMEEKSSVPMYDEDGSHRKQCPECEKYVGTRQMECGCGHTFETAPVAHDRYGLSSVDFEASKSKQVCGCNGFIVIAPAGECPVKLQSTDPDDLVDWVAKVLEAGHQDGKHYAPAALRFYAREFYDLHSPEYVEIVAVMGEMLAGTHDFNASDAEDEDLELEYIGTVEDEDGSWLRKMADLEDEHPLIEKP